MKLRDRLTLANTFDWLFAACAVVALGGVLHTFVLGRHFIIPTVILTVAVVAGNLAWYGLQGRVWVKHVLFWSGFLLTCHAFFALFWAKRYRELLGAAFEPVFVLLTLVLAFLTWQYARRNALFAWRTTLPQSRFKS